MTEGSVAVSLRGVESFGGDWSITECDALAKRGTEKVKIEFRFGITAYLEGEHLADKDLREGRRTLQLIPDSHYLERVLGFVCHDT